MGKILTNYKDIEKYVGMSIEAARKWGFPIAQFGKLLRANTDDLDRHVSKIAEEQRAGAQK